MVKFEGEFKNQFFLLVLKLFCQKTDMVVYFLFLVYLVFNIASGSSTNQYWGYITAKGNSCIGNDIHTFVNPITFVKQNLVNIGLGIFKVDCSGA